MKFKGITIILGESVYKNKFFLTDGTCKASFKISFDEGVLKDEVPMRDMVKPVPLPILMVFVL